MDIRYARNMPALSEEECGILQEKRVCVVGCGGLGGYVIELLARIGVGALTVVDGDAFDETNLNRQLLSDESVLGIKKAKAAQRRVSTINSAASITAVEEYLTADNAASILEGCDLAVDALDSAEARKVLAGACAGKSLRIVHGAISGWCAQVAIVEPGSGVFNRLYPPPMPPVRLKRATCPSWRRPAPLSRLPKRSSCWPAGRPLFWASCS